nr:MAG TPA: hypothetical protein [Caudoviricetes sp.]
MPFLFFKFFWNLLNRYGCLDVCMYRISCD